MNDMIIFLVVGILSFVIHEFAHLFVAKYFKMNLGGIEFIGFWSVGVRCKKAFPHQMFLMYLAGSYFQIVFILLCGLFLDWFSIFILLLCAIGGSIQDFIAIFLLFLLSKEKNFWNKKGEILISWR